MAAKHKFVAVPAIFLLDGSGEVIDMFQGEVTSEELLHVAEVRARADQSSPQ